MCAHACTMACMEELALSLHHVGPPDHTEVARCPLSHLSSSSNALFFFFLNKTAKTNKQTNSYPETEPDAARPAAVTSPVCCHHKGEKEQLEMCMVKNT